MKTSTRPRVIRTSDLGGAARAGVAAAIEDRVTRFGPQAAIIRPETSEPFDPGTTIGIIAYPEPDPASPYVAA